MFNRTYTMDELRQCAEREVKMRRQVYPNRVLTNRMSQRQADTEIAKMAEIADVLAKLSVGEMLV